MKFKVSILNFLMLAALSFVPLHIAYSQTASILPPAKTTYLDKNGKPLAFGTVDFYIPGTTTPKMTWQDAGQTIPNTNPVVLDNAGRSIVLGDGSYRQIVRDKNGNLIWDQVTSSTGSGGGGGGTPTVGDGDPVGIIKSWSGFIAPSQYVFAYGQEFVRASYPELLSAITSQQNVSCTLGSPTLTGVGDTSQLSIGSNIESNCLNSGATIVSKTTNTIVASSNAIISTTTTARFFPYGNGNGSTTFNLPDLRGRIIAGRDNMGGIASNRLPSPYNSLGGAGGNQSYTLTQSNLPNLSLPVTIPAGQGAHSHTFTAAISTDSLNNGVFSETTVAGTGTTSTATLPQMTGTAALSGSSSSFSLIQPTQSYNYIIKILPDTNPNSYFGVASIGGMYGVIECGVGITCTGNTISAVNSTLIPPTTTVLGGVFSASCSTSNWFNTLDLTGTFGCSQPSFTDIAGVLAVNKGGTGATSFTANLPLIGNGTSSIAQGTLSGNTTTFATTSGSFTNGNCITSDVNGNLVDTGSSCGGSSSSIANIAALKALAPGAAFSVYVNGYTSAGDGGQGWFSWDNTSSVADNSCTVFQPSSLPATGRWVRQVPNQGQYSVAWCGIFPNSSTDIGPALNALILNVVPSTGGTIVFPSAKTIGNYYALATTVVSKNYVKFLGQSSVEQNTGSNTGVMIQWTGADATARAFDLRDTVSDVIDNITFKAPNTYTGIIIDIGATVVSTKVAFYPNIRNSSFVVNGSYGSGNATCIMANRTIEWIVYRNQFTNCKVAIQGRTDNDTYAIQSTTATISNNQFYKNQIALGSGGNGWAVTYNTFEGDHLGRAQAFTGGLYKTQSMYFAYNWMGDVTATGGTWFNTNTSNANFTIENNFMGGEATGTDVIYIGGGTQSGLNISNNYLTYFTVMAYIDTGVTVVGGTIQNNVGDNVAYCYSGTNGGSTNISRFSNTGFTNQCEIQTLGTNGYKLNVDGTIDQWGIVTGVAAGSTVNVTFPVAFTSACYQVQATATTPSLTSFGAPYTLACSTIGVTVSSMGTSGTASISWRAIGK